MRFAFDHARRRPRKLLTVVTKSNAQRHGMVFWDEIAAEVARDFPDVTWDKELVDAMTMRMVRKPASLDTIVATNLHADILSDLAAALAGSLGIAPTGNVDPERRFPEHVRADPRQRVRHHRQGHRQPGRHLLDGKPDARPSRRARRCRSADARGRAGLRRRASSPPTWAAPPPRPRSRGQFAKPSAAPTAERSCRAGSDQRPAGLKFCLSSGL